MTNIVDFNKAKAIHDSQEFTKADFPDASPELQKKLVDNFNWLFVKGGATDIDIHG